MESGDEAGCRRGLLSYQLVRFSLDHPFYAGGFLCENVCTLYGGLVWWFFVRKCGNMK